MKKTAQLSDSKSYRSGASADKMLGLISLLNILLAALLLMLLSNTASAYGHPAASELHLRMHDNSYFSVKVGNMNPGQIGQAHVINNLNPGRHYIEVVSYQVYYTGHRKHFRNPQRVFAGHINISGRSSIFAMIDHRGRYRVESRQNMHPHAPVYAQPVNAPHGYAPVVYVMSPQSFGMLMNTMANTPFDSSRLNIAQQALRDFYVTSEQVYQLMGMFTFESNKLKLAQSAYEKTVDKHNYFVVHNAFTFPSSSNNLHSYIARNF